MHIRMFQHEPVASWARYDETHEADVLRPTPLGNFEGATRGVAGRDDRIEEHNQSALHVWQAYEVLEEFFVRIALVPMQTDMAGECLGHDLLKCLCHDEAGAQNGDDDRVDAQRGTGSLPAANLVTGMATPGTRSVWVFPGQGGQSVGMAAGLVGRCPAFDDAIAEVQRALAPFLDIDIAATLVGIAVPSLTCLYGIAMLVAGTLYVVIVVLAVVKALDGQRLYVAGVSRYADRF